MKRRSTLKPPPDVIAHKLAAAAALHQQGQLNQAEAMYREILQSQPEHFNALQLLATIASQRGNFSVALGLFDRVLKIKPDYPDALNNRGNTLRELKRNLAALEMYDQAITVQPEYAEAHNNRGNVLCDLKRLDEGLESYQRALTLTLMPDYPFLHGIWLHTKMKLCDWSDWSTQLARLSEKIERDENASEPLCTLAILSDPELPRRATLRWALARYPTRQTLPDITKRVAKPKRRIGYLLADPTLIPPANQYHYTEKIAYLRSYQVNDTKRRIADKVFSREALNLPASAFVFCCFNEI